MTQIARLYGSSMYDLAAEEQLTDTVLDQMQTIRQLFRDTVALLEKEDVGGDFGSCIGLKGIVGQTDGS